MDYEPIKKVDANRMPVRPNLFNYKKARELNLPEGDASTLEE